MMTKLTCIFIAGRLLPNTRMKVIDLDSGEERGVGETGELCFDGPQVMPG